MSAQSFPIPAEVDMFLHEGLVSRPSIELELKLGMLIDKTSFGKVDYKQMGIQEGKNKFIPREKYPTNSRFASEVSANQYGKINQSLNKWFQEHKYFGKGRYVRTLDFDVIYKDEKGTQVRVTYDASGKEPPYAITKEPIAPLTLVFGRQDSLDIRISASHENATDMPEDISAWILNSARTKSRISYIYEFFRIDITQVYGYSELEPEDGKELIEHAADRKDWSAGSEVHVFSSSLQKWVPGTVEKVEQEKYLYIKRNDNDKSKRYSRLAVDLAHKGHTSDPEISYEVEVELLQGVLKNKETRKRVIHKWMQCIHLLKTAAEYNHSRPHGDKRRHPGGSGSSGHGASKRHK
mmetsp:Transcript_29622/g.72168  ORF Transcript_29622/g.72168 Transcript_29622/m.72168 type:complete len:351 (+) Transcript_29622:118-1170(+)